MPEPTLAENRSKLKDFMASIATIRGDLSNITAPPFVLDTKSAVELPSFWAERPSVFVAPAASDDPAERALLVLKWFISSLRNQQYAGRSEAEGVKKPINAFLGEVFLAEWEDEAGLTRLVSEQVSHHPPVTACRVWNEKHGVSAEGYTRQEITFTGSINIQQIGHATLYLARHDETYLIPLPNIKIKSILTGSPYPELQGSHHIPSTSGFTSSIDFSGKGFFSSADKKHSFEARVYRDDEKDTPLYTISGNWDRQFIIHDCSKDVDIETFDITTAGTTSLTTDSASEQDPWESRRAWRGVREALESGNMQGAADAKSTLENGQREMRKKDNDGNDWKRLFYEADSQLDEVAGMLAKKIGVTFDPADTVGAWRFRRREWEHGRFEKPYHGDLRPDNTRSASDGNSHKAAADAQESIIGVARASVAAGAGADVTSSEPTPSQPNRDYTSSFHRQTTIPALEGGGTQVQPPPVPAIPPPKPGPIEETIMPTAQMQSTGKVADKTQRESPLELAQPRTGPTDYNSGRTGEGEGDGADETKMMQAQSGVEGMSVQEKVRVEDFLRDQYSSRKIR